MVGAEPGIGSLQQDKAFHHQAGSDQQDDSHRGFAGDQACVDSVVTGGDEPASPFVQALSRIGPGGINGGRQTEGDSGQHGYGEGNGENSEVDVDLGGP